MMIKLLPEKKARIGCKIAAVILCLMELIEYKIFGYFNEAPLEVILVTIIPIIILSISSPDMIFYIATIYYTLKYFNKGEYVKYIGIFIALLPTIGKVIYYNKVYFKMKLNKELKNIEEYDKSILNYNISEVFVTINSSKIDNKINSINLINAIIIKWTLLGSIILDTKENDVTIELVEGMSFKDPVETQIYELIAKESNYKPITLYDLVDNIVENNKQKIELKLNEKENETDDYLKKVLGSYEFLNNLDTKDINKNLVEEYLVESILFDIDNDNKLKLINLLEDNEKDQIGIMYRQLVTASGYLKTKLK